MQEIKEKLNNIALLLVMTSETDSPGIKLIVEFCSDIKQMAENAADLEPLVKAINCLLEIEEEKQVFEHLQKLIPALVSFCDNKSESTLAGLINDVTDKETTSSQKKNEFLDNLDSYLLKDYAESHLVMLDDLEGWILDLKDRPEDPELAQEIKRYIHTLKGDSGAAGLPSIERVCHKVEDIMGAKGVAHTIDGLIKLKEWVTAVIKYCLEPKGEIQSGEDFYNEFQQSLPKEKTTEKPKKEAKKSNRITLPESYTLTGEKEILVEFAAEAEEHLGNVESVILDSEGQYSKDSIDTIFRGVHSIKGGSAYFSVQEMTQCSHILENLLVEVRDGKRELDTSMSELLLSYIDLQKDVLERCRSASSKDGEMKTSNEANTLLVQLYDYSEGKDSSTTDSTTTAQKESKPKESPTPTRSTNKEKSSDDDSGEAKGGEKTNVKTFVKVETGRLDALVESVGEMVIYSSMLIRLCRELLPNNSEVMNVGHRVEKFSRDLQDIGMSMRLVPIKGLFQKMSRLVWDTSKKLGKDVQLTLDGEDTELDRNLIDKIADPLMHMVRNSLDHGLEPPEERIRNNKSGQGTVKLSAFHSGGNIHICIEDDGRGINPDKIFAKAVEKGLVSPNDKLSESEIFQLIFAPGFSTAAVVTDISGRGVGMDVVRKNVESLRGRIHIESKVNKGSKFTIELPLTLAILNGIQLAVGSEYFIMPSLSIIEFIKPKAEMITNTFEKGETLHFRGKYLPIFRLSEIFNLTPKYESITDGALVVVENRDELVAFKVDAILGECSTVIKNLGAMLADSEGLAGCAIMPRGEVALILDVHSLSKRARESIKTKIAQRKDSDEDLNIQAH